MHSKKRLGFLLLPILGWVSSAIATTFLPMNLDDLTAASSAVVYGRVTTRHGEWNPARTFIYTVYTIQAIEYVNGDLGASFLLHEPGGELDGLSMTVAGVPQFGVGQEAVFFVWTDPQGLHQVTGFEQGNLPVETDVQTGMKQVSRAVRLGSAKAAGLPVGSGPSSTTSRFLPQLFQQIRASAALGRKPADAQ
ncbi:MAG: hypothetical protein HY648_07960 [Acidobacteria bacterium]|nr:hypothetical protein [Acidobacteriota bacterium]